MAAFPPLNPAGVLTPGPAPGSAGSITIPFSGGQGTQGAPTQEEQQQANRRTAAQETASQYGVQMTDDPMSYQEVLDFLDTHGYDTANPDTQNLARGWAGMPTYNDQVTSIQGSQPALSALRKPLPVYGATKQALGINDVIFPIATPTSTSPGLQQLYAKEDIRADHVDLTDKGVIYYKNGVMVNYGSTVEGVPAGVIYNDANVNQEGSYAWVRNAASTWSEARTKTWRETLYKAGFLTTKKGGWDASLIQATQEYYNFKYQYPGVEPAGTAAGGAAAQGPSKQDIQAQIQKSAPSIKNAVHDQYVSIFADPPSDAELQSWSRFVINKATELATGGPKDERLSPSAAFSQAQAAAQLRIKRSPQAEQYIESYKENTSLHDGLTNAISATRGLA